MNSNKVISKAKETHSKIRHMINSHLSIRTLAPLVVLVLIFNGILIPVQMDLLKPFEPETTLAQEVTSDLMEASKNDKSYPTVEITSHKNGDKVKGKIKLTAEARDNIGLAHVGFYDNSLDNKIGDSREVIFDTTRYYGTRIIYIKAKDYAGNTSISSVTLNVENDKSIFLGKAGQ